MAGESEEAAFAGLPGGFEGFDRPAGSEDPFHIGLLLYGVHLPEIDVIGLQSRERNMQFVPASFPVRLVHLVVRKMSLRTSWSTSPYTSSECPSQYAWAQSK